MNWFKKRTQIGPTIYGGKTNYKTEWHWGKINFVLVISALILIIILTLNK